MSGRMVELELVKKAIWEGHKVVTDEMKAFGIRFDEPMDIHHFVDEQLQQILSRVKRL